MSNQEKNLRELQDDFLDYAQMAPIDNLEKQTEELNQNLQNLNTQGIQFHSKIDVQMERMEEEHRTNIKDVIEQCKSLVDEFSSQGN